MTTIKEDLKSKNNNSDYNYLDDSDYLSSDDEDDGYFSEDSYMEDTPIIDSIKKKNFGTFLNLLNPIKIRMN